MLQKLTPQDYIEMPWKNQQGSTTQLAISPPSATIDDFCWRISSARVQSSNTFSQFMGIDRSLAILDGAGLQLTSQNTQHTQTLSPSDNPYCFAGEDTIQADLISGVVLDLNVMTRRDRHSHSLNKIHLEGQFNLNPQEGELIFIFHVYGETLFVEEHNLYISQGESLMTTQDTSIVSHDALLYIARIQAKDTHS